MRNHGDELVVPHPTQPGHILEERVVPPREVDGLASYDFGTEVTMLRILRRTENPSIEFVEGTATPLPTKRD